MNVAIVGASDNKERYAYKARTMLKAHGYTTFLVSPSKTQIEGEKCYEKLSDIKAPIDTVTFYVRSDISDKMLSDLLALKPRRAIFNPGAENPRLVRELQANGILCEEACTLVLLQTNQW